MAEKIVSPGVFTDEIDQSFLPAAIADIGAAVIGPTVKGPALVPTLVNSYTEFQSIFGDSFKSGSSQYTYLTSITAKEYFRNSNTLTVVRILDGTFTKAYSYVPTGSGTINSATGSAESSASYTEGSSALKLTVVGDGATLNNGFSGSFGYDGGDFNDIGAGALKSFKTKDVALSGVDGILLSGSAHNIRWETTAINPTKGTFTLLIRRGDDTSGKKRILESFNNLSLDPNANNFVEKVIGNQSYNVKGSGTTDVYLEASGSYPNSSKYVTVKALRTTMNYLDENGNVRDNQLTSSLPGINSGSFVGGTNGKAGFDAGGGVSATSGITTPYAFYGDIVAGNSQGFPVSSGADGTYAYEDAINLLANQDQYDFNLLLMPGIIGNIHGSITSKAIGMCETRGDCFVISDPGAYDDSISTVKTEAEGRDSNYAAQYYPWIQVPDNSIGRNVWVPPSTVLGGIYAFNDKVAHPWFAPAGLNRGGIDSAVQAQRKLTQSNRDDLYDSNVNPISSFPGQGVTVFGQKTLQKRASALDRINVRRLLIRVKKFIASSSRYLVFEQNTAATRRKFLNIANPFLEEVQANSGLNAFRVVMDETNNTPDVVDRNILYGQLFLQPTRTAEFIVLDFTVQSSGATFPEE